MGVFDAFAAKNGEEMTLADIHERCKGDTQLLCSLKDVQIKFYKLSLSLTPVSTCLASTICELRPSGGGKRQVQAFGSRPGFRW